MGDLQILLIYTNQGTWEPEWEPLRESPFRDLVSIVSKADVDYALNRYSKPLVKSLGLPPVGSLRKIPLINRMCARKSTCPLFNSNQCFPEAPAMPWCFEPNGVTDDNLKNTLAKAIDYWRQGIYLVVVIGEN